MKNPALARFAWLNLGYNLLVVMWGAFVRATGAGAGCGEHWPLCNGQVIPREPQLETMVEFTHRVTSGLALVLVVIMYVWARRAYSEGHRVRRAAGWSTVLMIIEALIGAGLVLFALVADDESMARAVSLALHLVNTFLLLAAITLTAWFASGKPGFSLRGQGARTPMLISAAAATVIVGASGAVIALGDTLIAAALRAGRSALSPMVQFLLEIRVAHPVLAVVVAIGVTGMVLWLEGKRPASGSRLAGMALVGLFVVQLLVGLVNVSLGAPVWIQLVHLLLADLVWLSLVLYAAEVLAEGEVTN
jgi:cytochrome c oxidase assembly protein subunit 15